MRKFLIVFCCISFCLLGCNGDGGGGGTAPSIVQEPDALAPAPGGVAPAPAVETNPTIPIVGKMFYSIPFIDWVTFGTWSIITKVESDLTTTLVEEFAAPDGGVAGIGDYIVYSMGTPAGKQLVRVAKNGVICATSPEYAGTILDYYVQGKQVLYIVRDGNGDVFHCMDMNNGQEVFSLASGGWNFLFRKPIFSADGSKVYFAVEELAPTLKSLKFHIKSFSTGAVPPVMGGCDNLYSKDCGAISADFTLAQFGDHNLLFVWENKLWKLDIPTGVATEIVTGWNWVNNFSLSPDEKQLIIWGGVVTDEVGLLETATWTFLARSELEFVQNEFFEIVTDACWLKDKFAVMLKREDISDPMKFKPSYKVYVYSLAGGTFLRSQIAEEKYFEGMIDHDEVCNLIWVDEPA